MKISQNWKTELQRWKVVEQGENRSFIVFQTLKSDSQSFIIVDHWWGGKEKVEKAEAESINMNFLFDGSERMQVSLSIYSSILNLKKNMCARSFVG